MSLLHDQLARDLDRSVYDTARGFAELITTPYGEARAIVSQPFVAVDAGEVRTGDAATPVIRMLTAEAAALAVGDLVTVRGDACRVIDKQPGYRGETEIVLRRPLV